ncbi:thiol reductant ABC exporter subunit CydD [Actinomadura oligospora]|uniref:thiol reductant ABC exporter subunit CydD n=1 Tax=Actinomadura oligospora TaxID=111804 RepID=UPI0004B948E2|nr:thiol reductant ABC exporter subunit CydD [Actinomadura oligospora]
MPRPLDPRLVREARATAPYLVACAVSGGLAAACALAQAALLAHGIAALTVPLALIGVVAFRGLLVWGQQVTAHRAAAGVKAQLRARVLDKVVRNRPDGSSGEITALVTRGVDALDPYFAGYLPQLVLSVIVPVTVVVALLVTDPQSAVIVAVTLPLIPMFGALIGLYTAGRTRRRWRSLEVLAGHFTDVVTGLPTLKAFGRAKAQAAQIERITGEHRRATMGTLKIAFLSALVLEIAATLSVALVAVSVGLRLVSGSLTFETALFVLILAPEAYLPLRAAGAQFHAAQDGVAAAEKIFAALDAPGVSVPEEGSARPHGEIRVEDVTVVRRDLVGPFSFTAPAGELTVLAGPSGLGKTTLLDVLLGFTPAASGRVLADGAEVTPGDEWRRGIAWVPQRTFLIAGTVADNIALAVPGASGAAVRRAAEAVGITRFTSLDAEASALSAGQRQRVALARAVLRVDLLGTPLVLLDEPTAHLDPRTELEVLDLLDGPLRGRTVIATTHRSALLERADHLVRLDTVPVPA